MPYAAIGDIYKCMKMTYILICMYIHMTYTNSYVAYVDRHMQYAYTHRQDRYFHMFVYVTYIYVYMYMYMYIDVCHICLYT